MAKRTYGEKIAEKRRIADDVLRRFRGVAYAALAQDAVLREAGVTEQFLRSRAKEIGLEPKVI